MPSFTLSKNPVLICKDSTVSGKYFELRRDDNYDMLVTFPRPKDEELSEFYKSEKYISHTDASSSFMDKLYQWVKMYMLKRKISWIEETHKEKGSLLDFGAGTGDFLLEAQNRGWKVKGIEPNSKARSLAEEKGVEVLEDSRKLKPDSFDVISLWHVLEHVPNLEKQIMELDHLLKEDGLLVIAVPNFNSYDALKYKEHWAAYDVPRHLYHFSKKAITKIFRNFSFEVVDVKPLTFDAYYVSLLSEKQKDNSSNPFRGILTGLISNFKAKKTGEYSSLVYFLKKKGKTSF